MKIFQFTTPKGTVTMMVDLLSTDLNIPATIMDIEYNITDTALTSGFSGQVAKENFQRLYPYFAAVQETVSSGAALKAIATANNLTLKMYDSSSAQNGGDSATTLNTSTTTTTTTAAPTTTTTTAAPTTTTTTTGA